MNILRYFSSYKERFQLTPSGYVPQGAYRHIREALDYGISKGAYSSTDPDTDAKVVTHAVNGFVLEYYPYDLPPEEKEELVAKILDFIERALTIRRGLK